MKEKEADPLLTSLAETMIDAMAEDNDELTQEMMTATSAWKV